MRKHIYKALKKSAKMTLQEIRDETGALPARSYFIIHEGRTLDMKAIYRFARKLAGKGWSYPPFSSDVAAYLSRVFKGMKNTRVVHLAG